MKPYFQKLKITDPKIKKLIKKYRKKYSGTYDDFRDMFKRREKKAKPIVAVFGALAILGVVIGALISFFYFFYSNLISKKTENYMTIDNESDKSDVKVNEEIKVDTDVDDK